MGGGLELGRHLGIHGDHDLLLLAHQCIPLLHLLRDPGLELFTENSRDDVDQPLLWDFRHVDLVGEVHEHVGLVDDELEDLLDGEVLVLRHVEGLHLVVVDVCLPPGQDVLEEVDGDVVCPEHEDQKWEETILTIRRKIDLAFSGEEGIALTLAFELCSKGFCRDLLAGDMALSRNIWFLLLRSLELLLRDLVIVAHLKKSWLIISKLIHTT